MSDTNPADPASQYQSTEEMVAAQAAQELDLLGKTQADLAVLQAKSAELADQYLRAKAETENARRRAEEEVSKARKFAVEGFALTVDQLIHHTSGIADYIDLLSDNGIDDTARSTDADALAALRAAPTLAFKPGRRFEYSNSNYFLLGQIVQRVTGDGIGTFVGREIFRPLTLDARMDAASRLPGKARSYARDGGTWVSADSAWLQLGDGGIQTTPTQLVRWASQYWSPTVGGPSINTVRWIGAVQTDERGVRYGFGMQDSSDPDLGRVLFHDGSWGGFSTSFEVLPSRQLAVAGTCTSGDLDIEQTDWASEVVAAWARS